MPQKTVSNNPGRRRVIIVLIPVLIILFPLGHSIVGRVIHLGAGTPDVFLERPDPQYDRCVKETTYMRYHHWELLRGIREEVVRYGKRGEIGLDRCKDCHTSKERFCNQCHNAVSLTPDCFGCHYYP